MKSILTIIGARPQFIKAAVVSKAFSDSDSLEELIVHTGQHFDPNMSDVFFDELGIPKPVENLGISSTTHGAMTGDMLKQLESMMMDVKPVGVLVYGDTNSTLAGALAAAKLNIPIAHVEAGLRSFNRRMPEEINRIMTDHCSDLLFTPTQSASVNLINEGVEETNIYQCGDVMFDSAIHFGKIASERNLSAATFGFPENGYVLATIHRQENTDDKDRLLSILQGLNQVAGSLPVVLPLHPRTRHAVVAADLSKYLEELEIIEPTGFLEMIALERDAAVIVTDSGGVQKEAFFHEVPCITVRDETEWVELVESGWNTLAPPLSAASLEKSVLGAIGTKGQKCSPYGDGAAAARIVKTISSFLQ